MVSPHLNGDYNSGDSIANDQFAGTISDHAIQAPKSPLPKQKQIISELPPIFSRIAYCESRDRQFYENGNLVRGTINPHDIGRYQINMIHWSDKANELGFDLTTEDGNEAMALHLYQKFGTKPWRSSQKCWNKGDQAYLSNQ